VLAVLSAGCGTGGLAQGGDAARGGQLFVKKCASCHVLRAANAKGQTGPNLDNAFGGDRRQQFKSSTIKQVVRDQIELANAPMPKNLVTGKNADSVAEYVSQCAAVQPVPTSCKVTAAIGPPLSGPAGTGQKLYVSLGCQGCHTLDGSKSTGPTFKGLFGSMVKLTTGQTVTADEAYLIEAIIDPDKQIVAGYRPKVMSLTIKPHSVSQADAKALVAFIKAQK
jgi:cytochrome c oxidase subunit 2